MQQDDQNTFKNHTHSMTPQNPAILSSPTHEQNPNPIEKRNLLHYGFNYILPSFWYQELIDLNHNVKQLQNIQIPSFETYINFLTLSGLQNPTQSTFHKKLQFPKESALFGSDFLQQTHYLSSKNLSFSKINNPFDQNQIQWTVINPILFAFIESKYHFSQQNPIHQLRQNPESGKNQNKCSQMSQYQKIPKIAVFFTKEFIHQNGQCKGKQKIPISSKDLVCFLFKNVKYTVPRISLNNQIKKQLIKMTAKPIQLILVVDQEAKKGRFFRKTSVQGFFYENVSFKEFLKSLIQIESLKTVENTDKFYIYDQFGQKIAHKIATIANLAQLSQKKRLIICTSQLDEIMNFQITQKSNLVSLIDTDFNYPPLPRQSSLENTKSANSINEMSVFFGKLSKERQLLFLLKTFTKDAVQVQKKPVSTMTGFRPYNKQANDIKIFSGTFYRQDDSAKSEKNENNRQIDEVRYFDSATTNLDTPAFEFQNQSEKACSHSNYENARLKKHTSYNRAQRKKKSQFFLHKKKKNNYILRGTAVNTTQTVKNENDSGDQKKRIKHPLFHSLCSLQNDNETLEYLLENMRKVAQESIYNTEQFIRPIISRNEQKNESQQFVSSIGTAQSKKLGTKRRFKFLNRKKKFQEDERSMQIKKLQKSLQKISNQIQRFYEPQIQLQKGEEEYKGFQKSMLEKLIDDYELKKDNEQIRTIIDNSEGPYSQVEKHSFKINYRFTQKTLQKISIDNDQIKSMSDGLNPIQDNDQTI